MGKMALGSEGEDQEQQTKESHSLRVRCIFRASQFLSTKMLSPSLKSAVCSF